MSAEITLHLQTPVNKGSVNNPLFVIQGETTGTGIDPHVFVWQVGVAGTLTEDDRFWTVAGSGQMEDLPVGKEGLTSTSDSPVFYRDDKFRFITRNENDIEELKTKILDDIQELLQNHTAAQNLQTESTYIITADNINENE